MFLLVDKTVQDKSSIISTLNVEVLISVADRRKVVRLDSNSLAHCFEVSSTQAMAQVFSGIHQIQYRSDSGGLDTLHIRIIHWIRAEADLRVSYVLEEERIAEVTVSLKEYSIYSKDLVSVEPQAGVGVIKLTTVGVGILQVDAPHVLLSSLLKDHLLCESVLYDVSVGYLAICARCELALFGLHVVERHRDLPWAHVLAIFGLHPGELLRHQRHRLHENVSFGAVEEQLIVLFKGVEDHERDRELLPLLVELHLLDSHTSSFAGILLVDQLPHRWIHKFAKLSAFSTDFQVGYSVHTSSPANHVVVFLVYYGVLVVEVVLRGDERLFGFPDVTSGPLESMLERTRFLPFVKLRN